MKMIRTVVLLLILAQLIALPAFGCECPSISPCPYDDRSGKLVGSHFSQGSYYCDFEHKEPDVTHRFSKECSGA